MKLRTLIAALVVVGMVPAAAAQMAPANSPDASSVGTAASAQDADDGNYTKLYVDSDNGYFDLKPGERNRFTVTVKNGEDEAVDLSPHLYVPPIGENQLNESWVTIDGDTSLDAGEETQFTVTVDVPTDATLGRYGGHIAFTDEKVSYPGQPARPVHAARVNVEVWREPTVEILSAGYMHSQVQSGDTTTHQVVIENTGDEAVPVNPKLASNQRRHSSSSNAVEGSWLDIDAPNEIAPGETETVSITVSPPESAQRGDYNAEIDLGLKDPARDDRNNYWQRINLNLLVWEQPDEPFETSFRVSEDAKNVSLELNPRANRRQGSSSGDAEPVKFDVKFVSPDGEVIDAERVRVSDSGFVDMSGQGSNAESGQAYAVSNGQKQFVYRMDDPKPGAWSVRITPENTVGFNYQIVRNESGE